MFKITDKSILSQLPKYDTDKYNLYSVSLSDFPHGEFNNHVEGQNGPIDFYNVDNDIKVIALDEFNKKAIWANVRFWSEHKDREVVLLNLSDGSQIITDEDPRAIYGVEYENLSAGAYNFQRFTPTTAKEKDVRIPRVLKPKTVSDYSEEDFDLYKINQDVTDFKSAIDLAYEFRCKGINNAGITYRSFNKWELTFLPIDSSNIKIDLPNSIQWLSITSIEYTHKKETGYDLTVPGYETFMNSEGVILSNTVNVHVPGTSGAQQDVKNKLLPSKQVFSVRDNRNVVNQLTQEMILGMWHANRKPGNVYKFKTKQDALNAIKRGDVRLNDEIEIVGG